MLSKLRPLMEISNYLVSRIFHNGYQKLHKTLNNLLLATASGLTYKDSGLGSGDYEYFVKAVDRVGLESSPSNILVFNLSGSGTGGETGGNCNDGRDNDRDDTCDYNGCVVTKGKNVTFLGPDLSCGGSPDGIE